jgi:SPP1 family holin
MQVSKGTIVRTIMVILVILNIIFERCGIDVINVSEDEVFMIVETVIEIIILAIGFWKNNSFTPNAKKADKIKDSDKIDEVYDFFKQLQESESEE